MRDLELQAYHDGELGLLARWRVRRRLVRHADTRRELAELAELSGLVRESAGQAPAPDLWGAIRERLPAAPLGAPAEQAAPALSWLRWAAPAAAAVAAVALVWTFVPRPADAGLEGSLRWLHTGERSALVLQDDREATIIWVLEAPAGSSWRGLDGRRV